MQSQERPANSEIAAQNPGTPRFCAVIVLYRERADQSRSVQSLQRALSQCSELVAALSLCIYDNSPDPQPIRADLFPCELNIVQPGRNNGLAEAYNTALALAIKRKISWLVVLDSDTDVTAAFLNTGLKVAGEIETGSSIAALVPHVVEGSLVHSPRFAGAFRRRPVGLNTSGVMSCEIIALNSGSILRVQAIVSLGGFNPEFWLDYLDYWLFRSLQNRGLQVYVLPEKLEHSLSFADAANRMPLERYRNMLEAETYFTRRYGYAWERVRLKFVLLKRALQFLAAARNKSFFFVTLRHMISAGKRVSTRPAVK